MGASKREYENLKSEGEEQQIQGNAPTGLTITPQSFLTIDKEGLREKAMALVDSYKDGFKSPAELKILAKKIVDFGEMINENISDEAANELKLAKGEKRVFNGNTITEQMVGVRYDFSKCNSPVWTRLKAKLEAEESVLKSIIGSKDILDEETGEVYHAVPPTKSGKMALIIKY